MNLRGRGVKERLRKYGLVVLLLTILLISLAEVYAQQLPDPVSELRAEEVHLNSVIISFRPSASPDVANYTIYLSGTNASNVDDFTLAPGRSKFAYDRIHVVSSEEAASEGERAFFRQFWFLNGTGEWLKGLEKVVGFERIAILPSDTERVRYNVTGLEAEKTIFIAVTPRSPGGENREVSPVSAVPKAEEVVAAGGNEGIIISFGLIMFGLLFTVFLLARHEAKRNRSAYLYIIPALLGLAALTFYPVAFGFFLSFTDKIADPRSAYDLIGLENYVRVFAQPDFLMVTTTTFVWTVVNVLFHVTIGLLLAILLNRRIRGRAVYRTLLLFPWAVPTFITILAWRGMFDTSTGVINEFLGVSIPWLTNMPTALVAVILTNIWLGFSFMMMVFSGGLQGIPEDLYEAADVDGLSRWQKFRYITLPLLKPTIVPASLLGFIWTFNMFNVIYLMTQGGPPVTLPGFDAGATDILITYVYNVGFTFPRRWGFAAAYSVVIFFMLLAFGLFYTRQTRAMESFAGGPSRATKRGTLSRLFGKLPFLPGLYARLKRGFAAFREPIRSAAGPDQPEKVLVSTPIITAIVLVGIFQLIYGTLIYTAMNPWFIVTATHGIAFMVIGIGEVVGALGLALRQRLGMRLATWSLTLDLILSILVLLGFPISLVNLRVLAIIVLVRLLTTTSQPYPHEADPWSRLVSRPKRFISGLLSRRKKARWTKGRIALAENTIIHLILIPMAVMAVFPVFLIVGTSFSRINSFSFNNMAILGNPFQWLHGGVGMAILGGLIGAIGLAAVMSNGLQAERPPPFHALSARISRRSNPSYGPLPVILQVVYGVIVAIIYVAFFFGIDPALHLLAAPLLSVTVGLVLLVATRRLRDGRTLAVTVGGHAAYGLLLGAFLLLVESVSQASLPPMTLNNFATILFERPFFIWFRNSLIVATGTTLLGLVMALPAGYGFSRFSFRGKRWSMLSFLVVQMFPGAIILIPYYVLLANLGLLNSFLGLVLAYSVTALPFVVWMLKGFFDTIPFDLEEAAMVDGFSRISAFYRVILPLSTPAVAVTALFAFLAAWNEWLLAFTIMSSDAMYTLPVGITSFVAEPQVFWNLFAAISILVSIPVVILFIVFQKYLISGLTRGAVKG